MYNIRPTKTFDKHVEDLTAQEREQVKKKVSLLAENPMHPSLRSKRIQGSKKLYECSVNMDIRIIWYFEGDKIIVTVDVGHHDILKRY